MKNYKLFTSILLLSLFTSCISQPATIVPTVIREQAQPLTSTPIPQPTTSSLVTETQPATPTLTPEPGLLTNGPYFMYFRQVNDSYQLVMMDADGEGRKVINLPKEVTDPLPKASYQLMHDIFLRMGSGWHFIQGMQEVLMGSQHNLHLILLLICLTWTQAIFRSLPRCYKRIIQITL